MNVLTNGIPVANSRVGSRTGVILASALLAALPLVFAAPSTASAATLEEAVAMAVTAHPRVFGAKAAEDEALDSIDVERSTFFPTVDVIAGTGYVRTDNTGTRDRGTRAVGTTTVVNVLPRTDVRISLVQRIFDGFETISRTRSAEHVATASGFDVNFAADEIAVRAVQAYLNVLREREILALGKDNVAKHRDVLQNVTDRFDSGAGSEVDVFQAESRLALAESRLLEERSNLRIAEVDFLEAVGEMPADLDVPDNPSDAIPATVDDSFSAALGNNPELLSATAIVASRKEDISVAKSPFWPQINLELSHTWDEDADPTNRGIGNVSEFLVRLRYNLFSGGADRARTARAMSRASRTYLREAEIRRLIEEQIRTDFNELSVSRDQVPIVEARVMATSNVLDGYEEQFELGLRSLLDVLDLGNELFDTRVSLVEAEYRYKFAHYRLLTTTGTLLSTLGVSIPAMIPAMEEEMAAQ